MTSYGLPRYVVAILHIMEAHKDCLKWTVSERSHKLSLTLTWDFKYRDSKNKKTFWGKLQKTLKGNGNAGNTKSRPSGLDNETPEIPMNLIRFIKRLELETKEDDRPAPSSQQLQKQQRWSRYSLQSLPNRYPQATQNQMARSNDSVISNRYPQSYSQHSRNKSQCMKSYSSYHHLSSKDLLSPFHSSWPEESFERSSEPIEERFLPPEVVIASGGPSQRQQSSGNLHRFVNHPSVKKSAFRNQQHQTKAKAYNRSNEKLIASSNAPDDKSSEPNDSSSAMNAPRKSISRHPSTSKAKANLASKQWINAGIDYRRSVSACSNGLSRAAGRYNVHSDPSSCKNVASGRKSMHESKLIKPPSIASRSNMSYLMPTSATDVTSDSDTISDVPSEEDAKRKQTVNQTVIRCLDSCDKILYRHSTTIT